jgi:hypothetical protein
MSVESLATAAGKSQARSRVTNGSKLLAGVDGRTRSARRYRDVLDALLAELDRAPTESDLILAHRASALTAWCEEREAAMSRGEPIDMPAFVTSANSLRRLLSDLRRRGRAA